MNVKKDFWKAYNSLPEVNQIFALKEIRALVNKEVYNDLWMAIVYGAMLVFNDELDLSYKDSPDHEPTSIHEPK